MRPGVITCPTETPLPVVARMMSTYRVHCIVVTEPTDEPDSDERPWRVLSDLDLVPAAGPELGDRSAGAFSSEEALTVAVDATLQQVASVMTSNRSSPVVGHDREGRPVGVVSTIDVIDLVAAAGR